MLITGKTGEQINKKRKALGLSVRAMAVLLSLPVDNIYKWQKGTRPNDLDHVRKLEMFITGRFDRFVIGGKVPKDYDYDKAIELLFPRKPTNDIIGEKNIAAEPEITWELIKSQKETIQLLKEKVAELEDQLKAPVVKVRKTGG